MSALHRNVARILIALFFSALLFGIDTTAQTESETLLTTDNAYNPIPSPDGKYIAYVRTGWGEEAHFGFGRTSLVSDVKLLSAEGVPVPKTIAPDYFLSGWTPDSTRVVCYRDGRYALVSAAEGKQVLAGQIPATPDIGTPTERVAYAPSFSTIVWSGPVDTHRAIQTPGRTIVAEEQSWNEHVAPSPDGRYLAVFPQGLQTNLRVYDLHLRSWTDFGTISVHPDKDWSYIEPNWNPWFADGSRLVFLKNSALVISTPDGKQRTNIKIDGPAGLPVPSPDGQSIAHVTFEPRPMQVRPDLQFWGGTVIWVVSAAAETKPRAVTTRNVDEVYDLKWLNNETVVFDRVADEMFYKQARIWKVSMRR